jgi:hypothetical protein
LGLASKAALRLDTAVSPPEPALKRQRLVCVFVLFNLLLVLALNKKRIQLSAAVTGDHFILRINDAEGNFALNKAGP